MSGTLLGVDTEDLLLSVMLSDGETGEFPRVRIYNDAGTEQAGSPVDLSHVADGFYQGTWTPSGAGQFSATVLSYTDGTYTTLASRKQGGFCIRIEDWTDLIESFLETNAFSETGVDTIGAALALMSAMGGAHSRDDLLTVDANDRPLTFRRRIFATTAAASASTPGGTSEGEVITINLTASHVDADVWQSLLRTR